MFFKLLDRFPKPKSDLQHQQEMKANVRSIVARYSRGNVRLQQGKYMTAEQAEKLKAEVLKYKF